MKTFLSYKNNHRAAPLRLAARIISIMILAFLWPARGEAETPPADLDVSNFTSATTLTYKEKDGSPGTYAWYYKIGDNGNEQEFSGTLTGTATNGKVIYILNKRVIENEDEYAKLTLKEVDYTSTEHVFRIYNSDCYPIIIETSGESVLTAKKGNCVANSITTLIIDGKRDGLTFLGEGDYDCFDLANIESKNILKGNITIKSHKTTDEKYNGAFYIGLSASLTYGDNDSRIICEAQNGIAVYSNATISPTLEWIFDTAPANGVNLDVKDESGQSLTLPAKFSPDGKLKAFATNVTAGTKYTLWLDDKQQQAADGTSVFTVPSNDERNKLKSYTGITNLPSDWSEYGQTANVGSDGTDVSLSNSTYTVKTACGLAWISWVTNEEKTSANGGETHSTYYPSKSGFENCTVELADDISLGKPTGVGTGFKENWIPIGNNTYPAKPFKGTFAGNSHTISGMTFKGAIDVGNIGLFGYLEQATVKKLTVGGEISPATYNGGSYIYIGGISAMMKNTKIIDCHNTCNISCEIANKSIDAGGIVGTDNGNPSGPSSIYASSNSGNIDIVGSISKAGGIIATLMYVSKVACCFNSGSVTTRSPSSTGGIVGYAMYKCKISNCYSTGNITVNATGTAKCGGIVGEDFSGKEITSCFATGSVSVTCGSDEGYVGGIAGSSNSGVINNCLALNKDGIELISSGRSKYCGRIVGKTTGQLVDNYASTKIKLKIGESAESATPAVPTEEIGPGKINGENIYFNKVAAAIASWAGKESTKAFTAIGIGSDGKLPQLKTVNFGADDEPDGTYGDAIPGQPAANMKTVDFLDTLDPLSLSADDTKTITLSYSNGMWSYKKGEEALTCFNGEVKMGQNVSTSTNKLVISFVTGKPTLIFDQVKIESTDGTCLTIEEDCELGILPRGLSSFSSSSASTLVNKSSLTLFGQGLQIKNTSGDNTHYGLDNSGTFKVESPSWNPVTFHCTNTAIHNTGTLANPWMEWQFAEKPGTGGKIAFAATDDENQSPTARLRQGKTFATTVTAGKTYRLWTVTGDGDEVRTLQKGLDGNNKPVKFFSAAANAVAVYTEVEDLKTIEIADTQNFSAANCAAQDVVVGSTGVLTVDDENAFVFSLKMEEGAQLVTTKALKISETFLTTRSLANKWTAFGSPVALTASVGDSDGQLLYAATGYIDTATDRQGWENISGTTAGGTKTVALDADSPYLLAAETASTPVTFTATASADQSIRIPNTATVMLGYALADGKFLFQMNPNLSNLTLSDIYVLNDEGTRFELQTGDYQVKPFEAFIVANAVTRLRVASLEIGEGIATGIEQPLAAGTTRVWGTRGTLHVYSGQATALTVVRFDGRVVYAAPIAPGDTRLALPSGIYLIRINNITYKIAL